GTHLCYVVGNRANRGEVIVQPAPGSAAIGFSGRQLAVVDIARVTFGSMPDGIAVSMTDQAGANLAGDFSIDGDMLAFLAANRLSRIHVGAGASISIKKPVNIHYFVMSYQNSLIDFGGELKFKNSQFVSGRQYRAYWNGIVNTNGLVLPGNIAGEAAMGGQAY